MNLERIHFETENYQEIKNLYERAFPVNERQPFEALIEGKQGAIESLALYDKGVFCGFVVLACTDQVSHIIYFAIEENLRSKGYGREVLNLTKELKKENRIIVDIEREIANADNQKQRARRKKFYLDNGFQETQVQYNWRKEAYEILCFGGAFTEEDFENFWDQLGFDV